MLLDALDVIHCENDVNFFDFVPLFAILTPSRDSGAVAPAGGGVEGGGGGGHSRARVFTSKGLRSVKLTTLKYQKYCPKNNSKPIC